MAKKKHSQKQRQRRKAAPPAKRTDGKNPPAILAVTYEITDEPMSDDRYPHLPQEVVERLHRLAQTNPQEAIPELLDWIARYPDVPMLYNYLAVSYGAARDIEKYEQVVLENYARHPEYLFARLNYAQLLLRQGEYDKVADLLHHAFDIGLFYPQRKRFHISEFASFTAVVALYHSGVGNAEDAYRALDMLKKIAPDSPATHKLQNHLNPPAPIRLLRHIVGSRSPAPRNESEAP